MRHDVFSSFVFFQCSGDHRDLHSFPTRRSSDLAVRSRSTGQPWRENGKLVWTDTSNPKVQEYDIARSEEHTSELQSQFHLVCRLLLEKKKSILILIRFGPTPF